jgi:hypothetical protein
MQRELPSPSRPTFLLRISCDLKLSRLNTHDRSPMPIDKANRYYSIAPFSGLGDILGKLG